MASIRREDNYFVAGFVNQFNQHVHPRLVVERYELWVLGVDPPTGYLQQLAHGHAGVGRRNLLFLDQYRELVLDFLVCVLLFGRKLDIDRAKDRLGQLCDVTEREANGWCHPRKSSLDSVAFGYPDELTESGHQHTLGMAEVLRHRMGCQDFALVPHICWKVWHRPAGHSPRPSEALRKGPHHFRSGGVVPVYGELVEDQRIDVAPGQQLVVNDAETVMVNDKDVCFGRQKLKTSRARAM